MDLVTRRQACHLIAQRLAAASGLACLAGTMAHSALPGIASGEEATAQALAQAQADYETLQARIDELAAVQQDLSLQLDATLADLEAKQAQVDAQQALVDEAQDGLEQAQNALADFIDETYRQGGVSTLDILLRSKDFEDLDQNMYYAAKVSESSVELIEDVRQAKLQLEERQAALEEQLAGAQTLRIQLELQLGAIKERQDEAYALLVSVDAEVAALSEQYNQELFAQAQAAAAAAQAAQTGDQYFGGYSLDAVIGACYNTGSPGLGYCAAWVTNVFINAGIGAFYGDACDMYARWCLSSNREALAKGMVVAVSTWSGTRAGQIYGHIGIYVGDGVVMDNVGYIRSIRLDDWLATYSTTVTPRWGWLGGVKLG